MSKKFLLVTEKEWHDDLFEQLQKDMPSQWIRIKSKSEFTLETVSSINPQWIFIPHWSYLIPASIYSGYKCVVFHMTDLPYGRGGSPLQNLVINNHKQTKISAIKVTEGLDTGDIYLKRPLNLDGSAKEIFTSASLVIEEMIKYIIEKNPEPTIQTGAVTIFKRRHPNESDISNIQEIQTIYDYIRMLDCEGYPHAYFETEHLKYEFTNAKINDDKSITANVKIIQK